MSLRTAQSRREFLRRAGALSMLGTPGASLALELAALGHAAAPGATDYKALVCVFLHGGNDAYNTVLATDPESWSHYGAARGQGPSPIALQAPGTVPDLSAAIDSTARLGGVLPLRPATPAGGRSFALHPSLAALAELFNVQRRLAVVSSVGPLIRPTTKAQLRDPRHPRPPKLYSHNDQQSVWQAGAPEGATVGWGGRIGDLLAGHNGEAAMFTCVSAAGNALWLAGRQVRPYQVSPNGAIRIGVDDRGRVFGSEDVGQALLRIVGDGRALHLFEADHAAVVRRSIEAERRLAAALPAAGSPPYGSVAPGTDPRLQYTRPEGRTEPNELARQLQIVARMIGAGQVLGLKRQMFFVSLGSFDTHDRQNLNHALLMLRLSHAMAYFDEVLGGLGLRDSVTTFTASEFGRSFTSNGDGTDHGWGGHHFVMGGAVRGGALYGRFPEYAGNEGRRFASPDLLDGSGAMLPAISVDQYLATLARWFGLGGTEILDLWPQLADWDAGERDLGFLPASS
ncbi:DUF1501 domain-containing protein [Caldimonas tepidiphila]|uniref:DUF1501 domain-containing protein n=1 Tax=Caldimonas tepidiphila TaxID=2315841 RepID=UPI000E5AEE0F|nr:DUF1501 domain-containing protein [Caldimonas tepidiphila]